MVVTIIGIRVMQVIIRVCGYWREMFQLQVEESWGLSGYQARRQVADSRGPVLVAGLSLNK